MAERTNARLLKSRGTSVPVGSNPTPSAQDGDGVGSQALTNQLSDEGRDLASLASMAQR